MLSLTSAISLGLITAALGVAQEPIYPPLVNPPTITKGSKETVQETRITTDSGTKKTSTDTLVGKVLAYEPNKWIRVSTPAKIEGSRNIDLNGKDTTATVKSSVKTGSWVTVTLKTDSNGQKTVTVEPSAAARTE